MNDQQGPDAESKLAAPRLFGRKKATPAPAPASESEPAAATASKESVPPVEETRPLPSVRDEPVAKPVAQTTAEPVVEPEPARSPQSTPAPKRERRPLPRLSGLQIAGIAGLLVGIFLVLATYGSLHLCASARGTQTCGGKAGFPLLLAIGIVAVIGGGVLLRLYAVRSPMGDSFLAVALVAVVTVLFLNNHYDDWWMAITVPVLTLLAYLLAHWVSTTYIDPDD